MTGSGSSEEKAVEAALLTAANNNATVEPLAVRLHIVMSAEFIRFKLKGLLQRYKQHTREAYVLSGKQMRLQIQLYYPWAVQQCVDAHKATASTLGTAFRSASIVLDEQNVVQQSIDDVQQPGDRDIDGCVSNLTAKLMRRLEQAPEKCDQHTALLSAHLDSLHLVATKNGADAALDNTPPGDEVAGNEIPESKAELPAATAAANNPGPSTEAQSADETQGPQQPVPPVSPGVDMSKQGDDQTLLDGAMAKRRAPQSLTADELQALKEHDVATALTHHVPLTADEVSSVELKAETMLRRLAHDTKAPESGTEVDAQHGQDVLAAPQPEMSSLDQYEVPLMQEAESAEESQGPQRPVPPVLPRVDMRNPGYDQTLLHQAMAKRRARQPLSAEEHRALQEFDLITACRHHATFTCNHMALVELSIEKVAQDLPKDKKAKHRVGDDRDSQLLFEHGCRERDRTSQDGDNHTINAVDIPCLMQ